MSHSGANYYHTDDPATLRWLIGVLSNALEQEQSVRFNVSDQTLSVKRGEGMWSAPLQGTPDVYRDSVDNATVRRLNFLGAST